MSIERSKYRYSNFEKFVEFKYLFINNYNSSYGFSSDVSFFVDSNVYFLLGQRHIKNRSFKGNLLDQYSALRFFSDFVVKKSGKFRVLVPGVLFYEYTGSEQIISKREYKNSKQKVKKALGNISSSIKFADDINTFEKCKETLQKIHKDKSILQKVLKKFETTKISYMLSDYSSNIPFTIASKIADNILSGESFSYIEIGFLHYAISIKVEYLIYKKNKLKVAAKDADRYAIGELLELGRKVKNKDKVLGIADLFLFGECNARSQGATVGDEEYYNVLSFEKKLFKSLDNHSNTVETISFQAGDIDAADRGQKFVRRQVEIDEIYRNKDKLIKEFYELSFRVFSAEWKMIDQKYKFPIDCNTL